MSWRLDPAKTGLLVIDVQESLFPRILEGKAMAERVGVIVSLARLLGLPIYVTEQVPEKLGPTIEPVRRSLGQDYFPLAKKAFSACDSLPRQRPNTLLVVGIETHICVRQTVLDLRDLAVTTYVLSDACGARRELDHNMALRDMRHGDVSMVTTVEAVAWELLGTAEHPKFREALGILK